MATATARATWFDRLTSSRARRLGREFTWIAVGKAAAVLGAVVGVRLLTELLDPTIYGQLALGMTVATLIQQLVLGPLSNGATRFYAPAREAKALDRHISAVKALLRKATAGVVIAAILLSLGLLFAGQSRWIALTLAAVCFALLSGYNSVLNGMQNAARQRAIVALHSGLSTWGRFLLAALLLWWLGPNSAVAMLGYAAAILLVLFSQRWFFQRTLRQEAAPSSNADPSDRKWDRQILAYSWPFATWGIFTWAHLASDRWALQAFATTEEVGLYAVLYQLGYYPITMLSGLMVELVSPVFFQRAGDASDPARLRHVYNLNRRLTIATLFLTVVAGLLVHGLHATIFRILVAPEYHTVSWMLPGMVLAGGLFATGQFAVVSLLVGTQTHQVIFPKVATAGLGMVLNILGAVCYGMIGVVAAMIITAAAYLLWILWLVRSRANQADTEISP